MSAAQQSNSPMDILSENVSDKPPNKAAREYRKRMREKLIKKEEMISKLKEENQKLVSRRQMLMKILDEINKIISSSHPESFPQSNAYEATFRSHLQRLGANLPSFLPAMSQYKAAPDNSRQSIVPHFVLADDSYLKTEQRRQVNINKSALEPGQENDAKLSVEVSPEESIDKQSLNSSMSYKLPASSLLARSDISYNESIKEFMDVARPINIDYFNRQAESVQAHKLFASLFGTGVNSAQFETPRNSLNSFGMSYYNSAWHSLNSSTLQSNNLPTFRNASSFGNFLSNNRSAFSSTELRPKQELSKYANSRNQESFDQKIDTCNRLEFNSVFETKNQVRNQIQSENDLNEKKFKTPKDLWASRFKSDERQ